MVWVHNGNEHLDEISDYRLIVGVCIALAVVMIFTVGLRGYTRFFVLHSLGIDDYIVLFSAICAIVYSGLCIGQSAWGLGLPIKLRPKPNLNQYSIINFAGRPFYMFGILGFKVALCFAYLRILKASPNPRYKALIFVVMVGAILGHVAGTFILFFQCSPVRKSWRPLTPGKCLPNDATFYGLAAVSILFDVIIFVLPIPLLLKLSINIKKKIALICIFALGLLTTVCSVMRMVQILTIARTGNSTMLVLWGVIELNVGIILTCIPTLGPLFPCFHGSSTAGRSGGNNSAGLKLSNVRRRSQHLASGGDTPGATLTTNTSRFSKYGHSDYATTAVGSSDRSSDEDILGLKDAHASEYGAYTAGRGDEEIVKTTDIRVSVDEAGDRGEGVGLPGRAISTRDW
ncbi:MAG: hypothetical protein LQ342_006032 [Letrouitia transgressa]|nr:MAG: hypothetical protein LQ342_006032 [Letrouitia transgressa]